MVEISLSGSGGPRLGNWPGLPDLGIDGSGYLVFRWQHCPNCLTRQCGERTVYCHQVLEAKILGPAQTVLSLGTEFIDNQTSADLPAEAGEQKRKQDCE